MGDFLFVCLFLWRLCYVARLVITHYCKKDIHILKRYTFPYRCTDYLWKYTPNWFWGGKKTEKCTWHSMSFATVWIRFDFCFFFFFTVWSFAYKRNFRFYIPSQILPLSSRSGSQLPDFQLLPCISHKHFQPGKYQTRLMIFPSKPAPFRALRHMDITSPSSPKCMWFWLLLLPASNFQSAPVSSGRSSQRIHICSSTRAVPWTKQLSSLTRLCQGRERVYPGLLLLLLWQARHSPPH